MSLLSKLSTKIKILILVVYSLVAVLIALLIVGFGSKTEILTGYTKSAVDEYVKASYRVQETRQSSRQLDAKHETSTYKVYAYIEKRIPTENTKVAINDIMLYVAGENKDGKKLFDEPSTSTSKSISTTGTVASFGSNVIPNNVFVKKYKTEKESEILVDNVPVKLYFTLKYNVVITTEEETKEEAKTLKYVINLTNTEQNEFDKFRERKIINNKVENLENEPYDLEVTRSQTSSSTSITKDRFNIKLYLNSPNLSINKLENIRVEVFGKAKNDSNDTNNEFSDYVRMYTYCGGVISSSYSSLSSEIDEQYEISELYVIVQYKYDDFDEKVLTYKINVEK